MTNKETLEKLRSFILNGFKGTQTFDRPGDSSDILIPVFIEENVTVQYCPTWEYLEIYGLTDEEYQSFSYILNIC